MIQNFLYKLKRNIKYKKDKFFGPFLIILNKLHFSPNILSSFSLLFGLISAFSLFYSRRLFIFFILLHFLFDLLDGSLARYLGKNSDSGWILDNLSDRIVFILIVIVTIILSDDKLSGILFLCFYVLYSIIYIFYRKKCQLIYYESIYYLLVYFNFKYVNFFGILGSILNMLIILDVIFIKKD